MEKCTQNKTMNFFLHNEGHEKLGITELVHPEWLYVPIAAVKITFTYKHKNMDMEKVMLVFYSSYISKKYLDVSVVFLNRLNMKNHLRAKRKGKAPHLVLSITNWINGKKNPQKSLHLIYHIFFN